MRWPKPRDSLQASLNIRSIVFDAKVRQFAPREPANTRAASKYAETNMAFQETYIVLSTNGVGRSLRAASIFPFALAMVRRTENSSKPRCLTLPAASQTIHKTFFAGL